MAAVTTPLTRVLDRGQRRGLVAELHHGAAVDVARAVGVERCPSSGQAGPGTPSWAWAPYPQNPIPGRRSRGCARSEGGAPLRYECSSSHPPRRMRCRAFPGACPPSSKPRSRSFSIAPRIPRETLDYSYQKQIELLQNVKKGIADVVTSKKRLQLQTAKLAGAGRQARHPGPPGAGRRQRGARAHRARAQERRPDRAAVARHPDRPARAAAGADDRLRAEAAHQDRAVPLQEGGHQGPVLRRRGAGPDLRGGHRRRRGDGRRRPGHAAGARQDREHEGARRRRPGARGRGHVRGPDPARPGRGRHRSPAQGALEHERGRHRSREDEGRARRRHARQGELGAGGGSPEAATGGSDSAAGGSPAGGESAPPQNAGEGHAS